jgi:hypothetical protein
MQPTLAIGQLSIRGVDAATAPALHAAIETALAGLPAPVASRHIAALHIDLPPGATAGMIAAAIAEAVARQQR